MTFKTSAVDGSPKNTTFLPSWHLGNFEFKWGPRRLATLRQAKDITATEVADLGNSPESLKYTLRATTEFVRPYVSHLSLSQFSSNISKLAMCCPAGQRR